MARDDRAYDARRRREKPWRRWYQSREWTDGRRAFLARPENRWCACGCGRRADTVDHIKAHRGDRRLFFDRSNWAPWAFGCHSRIKQREEHRGYRCDVGADGLPVDPRHPFYGV